MKFSYVDEATQVSEEQWERVSQSLKELFKQSPLQRHRLLYGEWLVDECEDCRTREHVRKFADTTGKTKQPIYLCGKCAEPRRKHLREWTDVLNTETDVSTKDEGISR